MKIRIIQFLIILGVCLTLFASKPAVAQEADLVVSLSSMSDVNQKFFPALQKIDPQSATLVQIFMAPGKFVPMGMDSTLPVGYVVQSGTPMPGTCVFIPASNYAILASWFDKTQSDGAFPQAEITQSGKYGIIADPNFEGDPDPAVLDGLASKYLLGVDVKVDAWADFVTGLVASQGTASAEDLAKLKEGLEDIDRIQFGLNIDEKGDFTLSGFFSAKPGTKSAGLLEKAAKSKSLLSGFYNPDAAVAFQYVGAMDPAVAEQFANQKGAAGVLSLIHI